MSVRSKVHWWTWEGRSWTFAAESKARQGRALAFQFHRKGHARNEMNADSG